MARVAVLSDHVIDQIAAGEVIERPASVVKELVENAFDAGAEAVQVELEEGGLQRITVSDDGSGMNRDDATTCILRHATSKLRTADDLGAIRTLGFRGEALSSIASVSDMVIATREAQQAVGTRIRVRGGERVAIDEYGGPVGTTVDVKGLFFNTPARKKFMRSPATELAHVVEAALRVALGARRGGVTVTSGTRRLLDVPEDQSESERVKAALGPRVKDLVPFAYEDAGVRVGGFVTPLNVTRGDTKGTWFFVNGRFVRERLLQRALVEVFRAQLPRGQFPYAAIYIDVDPASVDVNVHPQKLEVRFGDSAAVYRVVASALTRLFDDGEFAQRRAFVPTAVSSASAAGHSEVHSAAHAAAKRATEGFERRREEDGHVYAHTSSRQPVSRVAESNSFRPPPLQRSIEERTRSQPVDAGRWSIVEREESVFFVDLFALNRRKVEARLRDELAGGQEAVGQDLVLPEVFEVDSTFEAWAESVVEVFSRLGLDIRPIGPERFVLSAAPAALGAVSPPVLVATLRSLVGERELSRWIDRLAAIAPLPESEQERAKWVASALANGPDGETVFSCEHERLRRFLARE